MTTPNPILLPGFFAPTRSLLLERPRLGEHELIGTGLIGVLGAPLADHAGQKRDPSAEDERQPADWIATWFASEIIPASGLFCS